MKTIIALLFSLGAFATSFAQYNHGQNNRDDQYASSFNGNYKDRDHFNKGNYSSGERNFRNENINRDFDFQLRGIQSDRYLRRRERSGYERFYNRPYNSYGKHYNNRNNNPYNNRNH